MLIARLFRIKAAIAVHFNLEIKQFNVVNAFMNAIRDPGSSLVAYKLPDRFKIPGKYIIVN